MSNEVASVGVGMETSGIEQGIKSLKVLADQGPLVEKSMAGVESAATKTGKSLKSLSEGGGKGLDDVGKSAPKAADGVGRVAKSADEAKRAIAAMNASVAGFASISTSSAKAAADMQGFGVGVRSSQQAMREMQAQITAMNQSMAQMGSVFSSVTPSLQAVARAQTDIARNSAGVSQALRETEERVRGYSQALNSTATSASSVAATASAVRMLNSAMAVAGVGFGVQELISMIDGYTKFTAQLKLATKSATDYGVALSSVRRIATDAQQGLGEIGTLYARIANGTAELNLSQRKLSEITETVALSLKVSGAAASESASAMLQLSQAFASGVLRGEEFNAVNEAAPRLMKALADGIGVPVGALRKMASEGQLTSDVLAEALPKALGSLRKEAKSVQTISGSFTVLKNNIMEMVGAQSNASGATKAFAASINALANNLDLLAAAGGSVALVMGSRVVVSAGLATAAFVAEQGAVVRLGAAIAGTSATSVVGLTAMAVAARAAAASLAFLTGPWGIAIALAGGAAASFYAFSDSAGELVKSIGGLNQPLDDLKKRIDALPPEKRIAVILDIKEETAKKAKEAEASFNDLASAMVGAFSGARAATSDSAHQVNDLVEKLENAKKTGVDMTPVLRDAAKAAGVSNATLKSWLDLAANIRAAREAAKTGADIPEIVGAGGGRGSYNPPTIGEMTANAMAQAKSALDATKAFKSQAEQMAEVRKEGRMVEAALNSLKKTNQGDSEAANQLRSRLDGVNERLQAIAKRGAGGGRSLAKSLSDQLKIDVNAYQNQITTMAMVYTQAQKIMEARRSAGGLDDDEYYESRAAFINLEADAQERLLNLELERYKQEKVTKENRLQVAKGIEDTEAKLAKVAIERSTALQVLGIQQKAAIDGQAESLKAAKQAAQDYLETMQRGFGRDAAAVGMGSVRRQEEAGRQQIEDRYANQRRDLANQRAQAEIQAGGTLTAQARKQYDDRLAIINEYETKALEAYGVGVEKRKEMEGDWVNGAKRAFEDYQSSATNMAQMSADAFTGAFKGMEDALVAFATTGKADFKSLANSIIADIIRMQARAAVSGLFGSLIGAVGGGWMGAGVQASGAVTTGVSGGGAISSFDLPPLFSRGGYTGPGGKDDPAGIVHKGEVVWSQDDVSRAGGVAAVEAMRRGGAVPQPSFSPQLALASTGRGGGTIVNIHTAPGDTVEQTRRSGPDGAEILDVFVKRAVNEMSGQIAGRYGPAHQALLQRERG